MDSNLRDIFLYMYTIILKARIWARGRVFAPIYFEMSNPLVIFIL